MGIYNIEIQFSNPGIANKHYYRISDDINNDRYFREVELGLNIWLPGGKRIFHPWASISCFELTEEK